MHTTAILLFYSMLITGTVAFLVTLFHEEVNSIFYVMLDIITFVEHNLFR